LYIINTMTLSQNQFYCVKCRKVVKINSDDICFKNFKNKRMIGGKTPALVAECHKCDTNLTKFVKHKLAEKLEDKFGKC
jgi:hypothetical protein